MSASEEISEGDFMTSAYVGFLHWAIGEKTILKRFKDETGLGFLPAPKTGLEALIDAACNVDEKQDDTMLKFIVWATKNYWGEDLVPTFYAKLKGRADAAHTQTTSDA